MALWFVMVGGEQDGPLTRAELGLRSQSGALSVESPVWKEGMPDWLPCGEVPALAALFAPERPVAKPPPYKSKPATAAAVQKLGLKPVSSATSKASSRSVSRPAAPGLLTPPEKGQGMSSFDTAHFRLADLPAAAPEPEQPGYGQGASEFNTAHFRLSDLPGNNDEGPLLLDTAPQAHQPGVAGLVDRSKPARPTQSRPGTPFAAPDHQQHHEITEATYGKAKAGSEAKDLASWASSEMSKHQASSPGKGPASGKASGKPASVRVAAVVTPALAPAKAASAPHAEGSLVPQLIALGLGGLLIACGVLWLIFG